MGAHSFIDGAYGVDADEAYAHAVETARYDYGHDPYNGTISTTEGFIMIPLNEGEDLEDWEERVIEDDRIRKWDSCACTKDPGFEEERGRFFWRFAGWAAS